MYLNSSNIYKLEDIYLIMENLESISIDKPSENLIDICKTKITKLSDWYFAPKSFERSGKVYEKLGIRKFHKLYLATYGKFLSNISGQKNWLNPYSIEELKNCQKSRNFDETAHILGSLIMAGITTSDIITGDYQDVLREVITNTIINVYPIMMQRYNRNRLISLEKSLSERKSNK